MLKDAVITYIYIYIYIFGWLYHRLPRYQKLNITEDVTVILVTPYSRFINLVFIFQIEDESNSAMNNIVQKLAMVRYKGKSVYV